MDDLSLKNFEGRNKYDILIGKNLLLIIPKREILKIKI